MLASSVAISEAPSVTKPDVKFLDNSIKPPFTTALAAFTLPPAPIKPALLNKPLVAISKPASIAPVPVAFTNNWFKLALGFFSNSSSNLLPAYETPKANIAGAPM